MAYLKPNQKRKDSSAFRNPRDPKKEGFGDAMDPNFAQDPAEIAKSAVAGASGVASEAGTKPARAGKGAPGNQGKMAAVGVEQGPMAPPNRIGGRTQYFGARDAALDAKADHKAAGLTKRHYGMHNELLSATTPEGGKIYGQKSSGLASIPERRTGSPFDPPKKKKKEEDDA